MFSKLKKFFSKKVSSKKDELNMSEISLTFQDRKLQNIKIDIKPAGNESVLTLIETKSNTEIALDQELCFILGNLFQEYALKGNITKIVNVLKNEENNE